MLQKIVSYFKLKNMLCVLKGSFEHPQHMLKIMGKKILKRSSSDKAYIFPI